MGIAGSPPPTGRRAALARLTYRWAVFLRPTGYCLRMTFWADWDGFGRPFRYLAIWALFASFFIRRTRPEPAATPARIGSPDGSARRPGRA